MSETFGYTAVKEEETKPVTAVHGYEPVATSGEAFGYKPVAEKTNLLSVEGLKSVGRQIIPNIKQSIRGLDLYQQEKTPASYDVREALKLSRQPDFIETPEAKQAKLEATQRGLVAGAEEIKRLQPDNPSYPLQLVTGAAQSIAQGAAPLAVSIATRNPAPAVAAAAALTKGQVYAKDRTPTTKFGYESVPVSVNDAQKNAGTQAAIEGALEMSPVGGLLKELGKDSFGKMALKYLGREEVTELSTTAWQKVSDRIYAEPDKPMGDFLKEMGSELVDTALTVPLAAGGTTALAQTQVKAQEKLGVLFGRKQVDQAAVLASAKADALAQLQQASQEAVSGLSQDEIVAQKLATGNPHADVPREPLTPEQEDMAKVQLRNRKSGATDIPPDPIAQADTADLDKILEHPVYQSADNVAAQKEAFIEHEMEKMSDTDPVQSRKVAERRANEVYPNALPATQRPIAWSTNAGHVGLNLSQVQVGPNDTVILGGNEDQFSPAYTEALGKTLSSWSKTIMPEGSRIVLNLSGLKGQAVGGYQQTASGIHVITPRELVRTSRGESPSPEGITLGDLPITGYNAFTQQQTFGAITHEFGHAVVMASFGMNMPRAYRNIVGVLDTGGSYTPEQLAQMPAPEAAVVAEYQAMKTSVLDGTMTAEQLIEKWIGTWKLGKDLSKKEGRDLYSFAKEALRKEGQITGDRTVSSLPLSQISALQLVHAMGRNANVSPQESNSAAETYYLQFNEYMAEQFSRYAYANKIDEGTALGVYFKRALASLRALFKQLKTQGGLGADAVIKPGVSFQSWIDQIGMAKALQMAEMSKAKEGKAKRKAPVRKATKPADVEDLPEVISKRVKEQEDAVEEGETIDPLEALAEDPLTKEIMKEKVKQAYPDTKSHERAELMAMIGRGELLDVQDQLIYEVNRQVKLDVKEAGGQWDPEMIFALTHSIPDAETPHTTWMRKAILKYLNKHAATVNDPLKAIEVPYGDIMVPWGKLLEDALVETSVDQATHDEFVNESLYKNDPEMKWQRNIPIGESYYSLGQTYPIASYVKHVYDYVKEFVPEAKIGQYDFVRAAQETQRQDARQRKKMETTEGQLEGTEVHKTYPDGFMWVAVKSPAALKNEGDTMGHCVGGYCEAVHNGEAVIYSLRDPIGRPHVTIEITPATVRAKLGKTPGNDTIEQIKGKQNLAPKPEYIPYVQDFISEQDWEKINDLSSIGLMDIRTIKPYLGELGEGWNLYRENKLGTDRYLPKEAVIRTLEEYHTEERARLAQTEPSYEGPYLDKDSGDAIEVEKALGRLGIKDTAIWKRAINFTKDATHYILQMQQLAHNTDDSGALAFVMSQGKLMAQKNNMLKFGTEIAQKWEKLGRTDSTLIEKVLMDEFHSGGHMTELKFEENRWSHNAGIGFTSYLKGRGIDITTPKGEELGKMILDMKNSILQHVQIIEDMAIQNIKERYKNAPLVIQKRTNEVRAIAEKWRRVPFVPQGHYGNYVVKVYEKNDEGKRVLAYQGHFESATEQDAAVAKFQKTVDPKNLKWMKLADNTGIQLSLPKDFLETLEDTGEFTSAQISDIGEAMQPLREEKAFSKFARDASAIAGASPDILRNYANWIEDSANFVSKLTWGRRMTAARAWTRSDMVELKTAGDIQGARDKQRLLDTMTKTQQFILHPMEEFFRTRSAVSLAFLVYAPKTALMNATGLLQTWAAVTADYGDIDGNIYLTKSIKDLMSGKKSLSADEIIMKNRALEDGVIDQGFGYFMSGLANAGNLQRRIRPTLAGRAARNFVDTGMYLFKAVETANRNLTMLAIYRAEKAKYLKLGYTPQEAYENSYQRALSKTKLLQNDYASGNRPEALRGKKSLFMIFLSYPQYMLWIMSGGYERGIRTQARARGETPRSVMAGTTMRMWLIFLALSGIEGVPFGETILDILQKLWKVSGKGENIRVEGQRFLKETMEIESLYWRTAIQRGFLHDVLGVDLSGSYSLGKPLPGLGLINPTARNWKEFVGETFGELSGPFGGMVKGGLTLGMTEEVDSKALGRSLPGAAGSAARAWSAGTDGVKTSKGERILRDENGKLREPTAVEVGLIAAGFRLSDVAKFQETEALKRQVADYWNGRRTGIKQAYKRAVDDRDPQLREEILKSVTEYNSEIPDQGLRLTGKELREFSRSYIKGVRRLEQDRDPQRVRGLNRDISRVME